MYQATALMGAIFLKAGLRALSTEFLQGEGPSVEEIANMSVAEFIGILGDRLIKQSEMIARMSEDNVQLASELTIYEENTKGASSAMEMIEERVLALTKAHRSLEVNQHQLVDKLTVANAVIADRACADFQESEMMRLHNIQAHAESFVDNRATDGGPDASSA